MPVFKDEELKKIEDIKRKEAEDLANILSEKYGLPYTDLSIVPVGIDALVTVPEEMAREAEMAAFNLKGRNLDVAIFTPNNTYVEDVLEHLKRSGFEVKLHISSKQSLLNAWGRYKEVSKVTATQTGTVELTEEKLSKFTEKIHSVEDVKRLVEDEVHAKNPQTTTQIFEIIIAGALTTDASDIHIQPQETLIRIRMRLDGILQDITSVSGGIYKLLSSRIKLVSGLKLNIQKKAQDGRFTIRVGGDDIEIRTSVLPGAYGETIVLRLLNPRTISLDIEKLGMTERQLDIIKEEIRKPNGMILNTGPTGSGKTTTLYSFLKTVNRTGINIITIEDPVEYHIKGVTQTQTKKGYTFLEGLRSALRQDPDIIMVGEIRDSETAKVAINSSLTGHLVFSTLHTNTAAGTIPRLLDLEIDNKVLGDALSVTMAQRLIRKLCSFCKEKYTPTQEEKALLSSLEKEIPKGYRDKVLNLETMSLWKNTGCRKCNNTGYLGREGVFEIILVDEQVEKTILENPSEREVWNAASGQGPLRLRSHGVLKVFDGITDLEELGRVVDLKE